MTATAAFSYHISYGICLSNPACLALNKSVARYVVKLSNQSLTIAIALAIVVVTFVVFLPVGHLGFIDLDDYGPDGYIVDNVNVHAGLTPATLKWAFAGAHASNWHPLTWISLMADYQCFGGNPAGYHWENLAWHSATALLLFLALQQLTGNMWLAALTALLFSVHPLRVESVAWVSERKDLLSGFFFALTLWFWTKYVRHARVPSALPPDGDFWKGGFYWLALCAFALGLMSKPMLVSVPVILLLLDVWPLQRFVWSRNAVKWLLFEKLPFALLALISCVLTIWAQAQGAAIVATERLPISWRLISVPLNYAEYLKRIIWPCNLAIFYPYDYTSVSLLIFILLVLLLIAIIAFCVVNVRRRPWLFVGLLWFLVMLLPVIGLLQAGTQSTADRYTYLPSIGINLVVAWLLIDFAKRSLTARALTIITAVALVSVLMLGTRKQLSHWRDSTTLFRHALAVNGENTMLRYYLGNAYWKAGDLPDATVQFQALVALAPESQDSLYRLGYLLMQQNKTEQAQETFEKILQINPKNVKAHMILGAILVSQQKIPEAGQHFMVAMLLRPGDIIIKSGLKQTLQETGPEETVNNLMQLLGTESAADIYTSVALIRLAEDKFPEAKKQFEAALALKPDDPDILNQLAWLLATCPDQSLLDGKRAVDLSSRACAFTDNKEPRTLTSLAAALARQAEFGKACTEAGLAIDLAAAAGDNDLVLRNRELIKNYRAHKAFTDSASVANSQ